MAYIEVGYVPVELPGITPGNRYLFQNQGGDFVRIYQGMEAPAPDLQDTPLLPARSASAISDIEREIASGNMVYAWCPAGGQSRLWYDVQGTVTPTPTPPTQFTNYLATKADTNFGPADFTISETFDSGDHEGIPISGIPVGQTEHIAYARLASRGAFSYVYLYQAGHRNTVNQITSWMAGTATVELGGEEYNIIYSRVALSSASNRFIVEAG